MGPPTPRGLIVCSLLAEGLQSQGWDSEAYPTGTGLLLSGDCSWNKCVCPAQNTASTCAHALGAPLVPSAPHSVHPLLSRHSGRSQPCVPARV